MENQIPTHRRGESAEDAEEKDRSSIVFKIRQVLNVGFIILGVIGGVMYSGLLRGTSCVNALGGDEKVEMMGAIIAIIAVSMKMSECILRWAKNSNNSAK